MNRKIASIDSSKKATQHKAINKKTVPRKTISGKKSKNISIQKNYRKR